jgi:hypothetical protein
LSNVEHKSTFRPLLELVLADYGGVSLLFFGVPISAFPRLNQRRPPIGKMVLVYCFVPLCVVDEALGSLGADIIASFFIRTTSCPGIIVLEARHSQCSDVALLARRESSSEKEWAKGNERKVGGQRIGHRERSEHEQRRGIH